METCSFALGVLVTVKQQSSSTPSTPAPLSVSISGLCGPADITSCLCPSVLLEWVSVVVWGGCLHQQTALIQSQTGTSLSQTIDSDQIKYLNIQSLYFLLCLPVFFSSYMFAALYRWALGHVRGTPGDYVTKLWLNTTYICHTRGWAVWWTRDREWRREKKKESNFSLAAVTYSLRSWVGSALIIPHINNPNSDWLVSPRQAVTWLPTWPARWPCACRPPPAATRGGEGDDEPAGEQRRLFSTH